MRGVSNVISALFVVAVILIAAYSATEAYITYAGKIATATKTAVKREIYSNGVWYGDANCDDTNGTMVLKYTGVNPEYLVRFLCYDAQDPTNTACVVPYEYNNVRSAQYVSAEFPPTLELNIGACSGLSNACYKETLRCVALGMYAARSIIVHKQ